MSGRSSLVPRFDPELLLWLEQGGVYVVANIHGGGEFGEEWHHAGRLASKQNCFDDFVACADYLYSSGITSPERLAIMGGSNGGLLMGAVLTQRPDIARVVVAAVPVMDSLRAETSTNGRFNTPEYGTVEDPELFRALAAYSPYHNVVDGTAYPAVLLTAGQNDIRADSWQAKKMTARLQQATSSDRPLLRSWWVLIRILRPSGRGCRPVTAAGIPSTLVKPWDCKPSNGVVQLWGVRYLTNPVSFLCAWAGRSFTPAEWTQYLPGPAYQKTCP